MLTQHQLDTYHHEGVLLVENQGSLKKRYFTAALVAN